MKNAISVRGCTAIAQNGKSLLRDIELRIPFGETTVLIGPNGAGKTSLLRLMSGDVLPKVGSVELLEKDIAQWPINELAKCVASLSQFSLLNFPYRVEEVVSLGRTPHSSGIDVDRSIVIDAMKMFDVIHLRDHLYPLLSGGEKQRVQLARIFSQVWLEKNNRIILLDEPTSFLDIGHQYEFLKIIKNFSNPNTAIVLVMHDVSLAAHCADRVVGIKNAQIVEQGKAEQVLTESNLQVLFGVKFEVSWQNQQLRVQPCL